ncbi:uncharacterized protein LOC131892558 [Tigriopus californicus]|uniref:uncharacterized protein LOC131892558 n=1 Tax=Tigriopus californicus TaxID=6832 RepID=UPI0027DA0A72|nr:uncharacterized protein LOC131892558 [Tigriopus californicus]
MREMATPRFFWTDSSAVRVWIGGTSSFYKTFVGTRIGEIQTLTKIEEWRHVPGKCNPADFATRSQVHQDIIPGSWISGPDFLYTSEEAWPQDIEPAKNMDEAKKGFQAYQSTMEKKSPVDWESDKDLDDLVKLIKAEKPGEDPLHYLIKKSQEEVFGEEMGLVNLRRELQRSSRLLGLIPFVDEEGLLRVGGRIQHAKSPYEQRHPIILGPKHPLTNRILDKHHIETDHAGVNHSLALLRQYYWPLGARESVKRARSRCEVCRKAAARPMTQIMADLPRERLDYLAPPFFHTSVDYFGPYVILISRNKSEKRWGCLFTCMTTRAVHLEVAKGLSEEDFLVAFRIFENLRGRPQTMYSDNGTNFIAAKKRLTLANTSFEWKLQPPGAPHWGGVHEALVKSVKAALGKIMEREDKSLRYLREEELRLMFSEVLGFLNSRPLTYESSDPGDLVGLSPNHFLLQRPNRIVPPGEYASLSPRRHYAYVQGLVDQVWKRWIGEYLPTLISRQKWQKSSLNLAVGDSVLVVDPNAPRGTWKTSSVVEVHSGIDGRVRAATVESSDGRKTRPITKLCLLSTQEE